MRDRQRGWIPSLRVWPMIQSQFAEKRIGRPGSPRVSYTASYQGSRLVGIRRGMGRRLRPGTLVPAPAATIPPSASLYVLIRPQTLVSTPHTASPRDTPAFCQHRLGTDISRSPSTACAYPPRATCRTLHMHPPRVTNASATCHECTRHVSRMHPPRVTSAPPRSSRQRA